MCIKTIYLKDQDIDVACGKCPECLKKRISNWSFRLYQEWKVSSSAYFITITYDTHHVPITGRGYMSLCKRDLQLFFKRLRKSHEAYGLRIKYYACGEYGSKRLRPHYHLILFNAKLELIANAWRLDAKPIGGIYYGSVTADSVGYTLKYMAKQRQIPVHRNDDRAKEFSLMSKGLGSCYLSAAMRAYHLAGGKDRAFCTAHDGMKISMPRYYKLKLYEPEVLDLISAYQKELYNKKVEKRNQRLQKIHGNRFIEVKRQIDDAAYTKMYHRNIRKTC